MFERFDDVDVPDQWDEIAARVAGPSGPAFEPGGHRMAILVGVAAAVLGIAGVLWVGLGDSDDDLATVGTPADTIPETAPPATTAPPTTAPPTTVEVTQPPVTTAPVATIAETAPPATSAPPTTAPPERAFVCTEIAGDPDARYDNDPVLERFGPLGAAPVLDITVDKSAVLEPYTDVTRVPGGTAILIQTHWPQESGWSMTVVNDDGSVRWRRCGQLTRVVGVLPATSVLLLAEQAAGVSSATNVTWRELDMSSGTDNGMLDIPADLDRIGASSTRFVLFGKSQQYDAQGNPLPGPPEDTMRLLDRATLSITELPYPPAYYNGVRHGTWFELVERSDVADGWFLKQFGDEYPLIASVFVDGVWTTDPAVIRDLVPVAAVSPYGQGGEFSGVAPLGEAVWTIPDRVAFWTEGPEWREDGDIDLLSVCQRYEPIVDGGSMCVSPSLLGVDGESGTILWELPGHRQMQAVGDGYALIGDEHESFYDGTPPGAWLMIDTATGQPIEGQAWTYETFETNYYSLEQINKWVRRDGAVVLAVKDDHVRVWLPAGISHGTISVSLPA